jgi:glycine/D-amino acid oxidase-like deaminating enzyme
VVDAAGAWVAVLAALGGASVPVVPVRHQLLITDPVAGYDDHPIVRILDHNLYTRPCDGGVLVGGYEAAPLVIDDLPDSVERLELDPTVPAELMRLAERWVVPLRGATVALTRGGIPTMTADGRPMFGWIPEMPGLLVVGGCNVGGLSISPAIGEITAGLVRGEPPTIDVRALDPMRHRDLGPPVVRREAVARYANRYHDEAGQPVVPNS